VTDEKELMKKLTQTFIAETKDRLKNIGKLLISLEKNPADEEAVKELFREAHTIKGSARMMGFEEIGEIAHQTEDIFGAIQKDQTQVNKELISLLLTAFDSIEILLGASEDSKPDLDIKDLNSKLKKSISSTAQEAKAKEITEESRKDGKSKLFERSTGQKAAVFRRIEETVRIDAKKLDELVNLVGELIIFENNTASYKNDLRRIEEILQQLEKIYTVVKGRADDDSEDFMFLDNKLKELKSALKLSVAKFDENIFNLNSICNALQTEILEVRLLPLSIIFDAFPRLVRDLCEEYGKEIDLIVKGGQTQLDKKMIEKIKDTLVHIVRNAIDHGIESKGKIALSAKQDGGQVLIEVEDDGAGIDPVKIKEMLLDKGLINSQQAQELTDEQLINWVFAPGFSTSKIITDISGRGVGLDAVKKNIGDLKGGVEVSSKLGAGTKFSLTLPLTLIISRALLFKVAEQTFALPSSSVIQTLLIKSKSIKRIEGKEVVQIAGKTVPLIRLAKVLQLEEREESPEAVLVFVVEHTKQRFAFVVDRFFGEQEIIVKNLGSHLKKVRNFGGATIIQNSVVPILYIPDIIEDSVGSKPSREIIVKGPGKKPHILIVEDSLTTREVEKNILESAGYKVEIASDGLEAIEKIRQQEFALIVTDVQMPRMNGFELTEKLKKDDKYKKIPIVIVTTLATDADKKKGIEVGADAYITKSSFNQDNLIDTVKRLAS